MSGLASKTVFNAVTSHALTTGLFQTVANHEPKSAPTTPVHMALYVSGIRPVAEASGLNTTSALLVITGRIYIPMKQEPQDSIDPEIIAATDTYMGVLQGDFTLGGNIKAIDIFGAHGVPLAATAGYIDIDQTKYRSMDISIPCLINDAWTQAA